MEIRYNFEPTDFVGHGQLIVRQHYDGEDHAHGSTVAYKVGYVANTGQPNTHCLIALSDGAVLPYPTLQALCDKLNNTEHGFRPLMAEEAVALFTHIGTRHIKA